MLTADGGSGRIEVKTRRKKQRVFIIIKITAALKA